MKSRPLHILALLFLLILTACQTTAPTSSDQYDPTYGETLNSETLALVRIGDKMAQANNFGPAAEFYARAATLSPNSITPVIRQAQIMTRLGEPEEAKSLFQEAMRRRPDNVDLAVDYARFLEKYAPAQMLSFWQEAAPRLKSPRGYNWLGVAHDLKGQHDKAQDAYRQGLKLRSGDKSLSNNLALSLGVTGKFAEAEDIFSDLTDKDPSFITNRVAVLILANQEDAARTLADEHKNLISGEKFGQMIGRFAPLRGGNSVTALKAIASF